MNDRDTPNKTVLVRRPAKVNSDDRGNSVWTGAVEDVELELMSPQTLGAYPDRANDAELIRIGEVVDTTRNGVIARDNATGRFEIISDVELAAIMEADQQTSAKRWARDRTSIISEKDEEENLSLVSTQDLRGICPRLVMSAEGKWEKVDVVNQAGTWSDSGGQCIDAPRDPEAALRWIHPNSHTGRAEGDWFDQRVLSCASDGVHKWGGITFYDSEGGWGVGGLVKQNISTSEIEFVRPHQLLGDSTGPLAYFAGELWFGQTWFGECAGPSPGTGLKKLFFHQYSKSYRVEEVPEVCGFAIRDFQEYDGALWVATELGLSRLTKDNGLRWTNFVPDLDGSAVMRPVECDVLYAELLSSRKFAETEGFDIGNAFDVFWDRLSELRPDFVRRHLRELHGINSD